MNNRQLKILELLQKNERLDVTETSKLMDVSLVTIRKDFQLLEEAGLLRRMHGYAERTSPENLGNRLVFQFDVKQRIAGKAAELVSPLETVMIESGSTCALLALELAGSGKGATVITNSAFIARYSAQAPGAKTILLGGDYQNDAEVMVGPVTEMCAREYYVDKLFAGVDGFTQDAGFTALNHTRANAVRSMAKSARRVIILTDSSKLGQRSVAGLFRADEVSAIVTDPGISEEYRQSFEQSGIEVIIAGEK